MNNIYIYIYIYINMYIKTSKHRKNALQDLFIMIPAMM